MCRGKCFLSFSLPPGHGSKKQAVASCIGKQLPARPRQVRGVHVHVDLRARAPVKDETARRPEAAASLSAGRTGAGPLGAETADFGNFARPGRAAVSSKPDARDAVKWLIDRPRARCSAGACICRSFFFLHVVVVASSLLVLSTASSLLSSARGGVRVLQHVCTAFFSVFYWLSVGGIGSRRAVGPDDRPSAGRSSFFLLLTRTVCNSP